MRDLLGGKGYKSLFQYWSNLEKCAIETALGEQLGIGKPLATLGFDGTQLFIVRRMPNTVGKIISPAMRASP